MDSIHKARDNLEQAKHLEENKLFKPHVGMRVRKGVGGKWFHGTVTKDAKEKTEDSHADDKGIESTTVVWEVTFDDGMKVVMDWYELLRFRADRPTRPNPLRGRQLAALELFCGCGIVTQEFAERKWSVRSVDNLQTSNATDKVSIMDIAIPKELESPPPEIDATDDAHYELFKGFIPDFIWASPPCFTYSNMAGGKHRHPESGQLEKTPEAHEHNEYFVQMAKIMLWAKRRRPHLIVVIENPVGAMVKMPLMKELEKCMHLYLTTVHYCTFDREDKNSTHLWTNVSTPTALFTCRKLLASRFYLPHAKNSNPSPPFSGHFFLSPTTGFIFVDNSQPIDLSKCQVSFQGG